MNIKIFLPLLIVLIIIGAGYFFGPKIYKDYQNKKSNLALEALVKINTSLIMNESQKMTYNGIREKLGKNLEDYEALADLARLKQDLLDFGGAIEIYQKLKAEKPQDIVTLNNLGTLYYNQKNYQESEKMYLKILEITPKWMPAYRELANIYRYHLKDKAAQLEPILLKGQEEYPEMKNDFIGLLAVYYDEIFPNKEKAIDYYEKLIILYPNDGNFKERLQELNEL